MPALAHQLRQLRRCSRRRRGSRTPCSGGRTALEEALAVEDWRASDSPDGRLQSGSIQVPPTGIQRPAATAAFTRAYRARGAPARATRSAAPGSGRSGTRVVVEEPQLRRPRAHQLALGLRQRPQPGRVEVCVPDGRDSVGRGGVPALVEPLEDRRVELVAEPVQLGAELARPGGVEAAVRLGLERTERLEVPVQAPRLGIEQRPPRSARSPRPRSRRARPRSAGPEGGRRDAAGRARAAAARPARAPPRLRPPTGTWRARRRPPSRA